MQGQPRRAALRATQMLTCSWRRRCALQVARLGHRRQAATLQQLHINTRGVNIDEARSGQRCNQLVAFASLPGVTHANQGGRAQAQLPRRHSPSEGRLLNRTTYHISADLGL